VLQHVAVCCGDFRESCFIELEMDDDGDFDKSGKGVPRLLQCAAVCCSAL